MDRYRVYCIWQNEVGLQLQEEQRRTRSAAPTSGAPKVRSLSLLDRSESTGAVTVMLGDNEASCIMILHLCRVREARRVSELPIMDYQMQTGRLLYCISLPAYNFHPPFQFCTSSIPEKCTSYPGPDSLQFRPLEIEIENNFGRLGTWFNKFARIKTCIFGILPCPLRNFRARWIFCSPMAAVLGTRCRSCWVDTGRVPRSSWSAIVDTFSV